MVLPTQPLSEHIAVLGAAVAVDTSDSLARIMSAKQQFAAMRHSSIERSLGEVIGDEAEQPLPYNGVSDEQDVGTVELNDTVLRTALIQEPSADNGLSSGSYISKISIDKT